MASASSSSDDARGFWKKPRMSPELLGSTFLLPLLVDVTGASAFCLPRGMLELAITVAEDHSSTRELAG